MKKAGTPSKPKKRWSRRLLFAAGVLFVMYLLAGFLLLPLGVKSFAPGIAAKHLKGEIDFGWVWLNPLTFQLSAKEFSWEHPEGEEIFGLDELRLNVNPVGSLFKGEWRIGQILLDGIRVDLRIDENGSLNISDALVPKVPTEAEEQATGSQLPSAWLGSFELIDATISLTDLSGQVPFKKEISPIHIKMADIHTRPEQQNDYQLSAASRDNEQIELSGSFFMDPFSLTGTLSGKEIRLSDYTLFMTPTEDLRMLSGLLDFSFDFEAHVLEQPLTATLRNAQLRLQDIDLRLEGNLGANLRLENSVMENISADVSIDAQNGLRAEAQARLEMNRFRAILDNEEQPFMAFEQFRVEDVGVSALPLSLKTGDIVFKALDLSIKRTESGELALMGLFPPSPIEDESPPVDVIPAPEVKDRSLPEVEIARFLLEQGSLHFQDASVKPVADIIMSPIDLSVEPISLSPEKLTRASFAATVLDVGSIQLEGQLLARDSMQETETKLTIRDLPLVAATPYTTAFIGRGVEEGSFSGDFEVSLNEKQLNAQNALRIQSIRLGETVPGYSGKTYPVGTAIALMENNKGLIEINVPVSGDLGDPTFHPFQVFTKVLQNLLLKAATAPFNIAANMTGGVISGLTSAAGLQGEPAADYSRVSFTKGSAQLDDQAGEVLNVIADLLEARPHIRLRIQGSVQPTEDLQALQEARFRDRLDSFAGSSRTEKIRNAYKLEIVGKAPAADRESPDEEVASVVETEVAPSPGETPAEEPVLAADRPKFYLGAGSKSTPKAKIEEGFYLGGGSRSQPAMRPVVRVSDPVAQTPDPPLESPGEASVSTSEEPPSIVSRPAANLPSVADMQRLLSELWFDAPPDFHELTADRARAVRKALVDVHGVAEGRLIVEESPAREGSLALFHLKTQFDESDEK